MDEEGLRLLSGDEAGYFQAFDEMFNTEGWRILGREIQRELDAMPIEKFWSCKSYEELVQARLRYVDLSRMMNLEAEIEARRQSILATKLSELGEQIESQYE